MQPGVGQEDGTGQEDLSPGNWTVFTAIIGANRSDLSSQSQRDEM